MLGKKIKQLNLLVPASKKKNSNVLQIIFRSYAKKEAN